MAATSSRAATGQDTTSGDPGVSAKTRVRASSPLRWPRVGVEVPISLDCIGETGCVYGEPRRTTCDYLRARYYEPSTAQFLTRDSLVSMTREPYAYASNNPLNSSDPSGLLKCSDPSIPCMGPPDGWQPPCTPEQPCINGSLRFTQPLIFSNGVWLAHLGGNDCLGELNPNYLVIGPASGYHWDQYTVPGARTGDVVRETAPWSDTFIDSSGKSVWVSADPLSVNNDTIDGDLHLDRSSRLDSLWETLVQALSFF
jgi:RHS repeat-associated protein